MLDEKELLKIGFETRLRQLLRDLSGLIDTEREKPTTYNKDPYRMKKAAALTVEYLETLEKFKNQFPEILEDF